MQVQVYLKDHIHGDMGLAFLLSYAISIEKLNLPSLAEASMYYFLATLRSIDTQAIELSVGKIIIVNFQSFHIAVNSHIRNRMIARVNPTLSRIFHFIFFASTDLNKLGWKHSKVIDLDFDVQCSQSQIW